ncbi:MAG: hypothetical protein QG597_5223 [Actinomycetota bacterium]|nr:hypothetical protein [Actinomycetota bacterium]
MASRWLGRPVLDGEAVTGVGLSEMYHRFFALQVRAAAELLAEAQSADMELDRARLLDAWDVHVTPQRLTSFYAAESELVDVD